MEFGDVLCGRRSVRDFRADAVPREVIHALIDAAAWAPSAIDAQALTYVVSQDKGLLDRMSRQMQAHALRYLPPEEAIDCFHELTGGRFHAFYHAPAIIVVAAQASSPWAVEDASLAAQNLMLAAYARGLGSCWIGFARDWLREPEGRAALGISDDLQPVAAIAVGWPKAWPDAPERRPQRIHWVGQALN